MGYTVAGCLSDRTAVWSSDNGFGHTSKVILYPARFILRLAIIFRVYCFSM